MEPHLHPFAVHFPIALILLVLVLDWGRWLLDREKLVSAGFWCGTTPILIVALIGAVSRCSAAWRQKKWR